MSRIHIERVHSLGLPTARRLARRWAEKVVTEHGLHCRFDQGASADQLHFSRSGVSGTLDVTADRFRIDVQLGLLMSVFAGTIETQLTQKLERQIEKAQAGQGARV
ncbi:polyhydroxyalkanoic acid system family protein [uncultured Azohydromonas sp.]|jgi:putative polyhydroxyalkanoic acid system protein|uniref:polyhydroxyalkanoic acid system family protein n=1 Tax=uncultured Azohydromonas sp. TaxID=487342 RepID=UPI002615F69B|nr:polyhydroxyalkanoic acid system family protein [uncultured Azohydromonas sp.]